MRHEVGHALGPKHPHQGSPKLPVDLDCARHTVMTYRTYRGDPGGWPDCLRSYPFALGGLDGQAIRLTHAPLAPASLAQSSRQLDQPGTPHRLGRSEPTPGSARSRLDRSSLRGDLLGRPDGSRGWPRSSSVGFLYGLSAGGPDEAIGAGVPGAVSAGDDGGTAAAAACSRATHQAMAKYSRPAVVDPRL
jgi:hypothetical protein